jgi:hypothetical protein
MPCQYLALRKNKGIGMLVYTYEATFRDLSRNNQRKLSRNQRGINKTCPGGPGRPWKSPKCALHGYVGAAWCQWNLSTQQVRPRDRWRNFGASINKCALGTPANDIHVFCLVAGRRFDLTKPSLSFGESQGSRPHELGIPLIHCLAMPQSWRYSSRYDRYPLAP